MEESTFILTRTGLKRVTGKEHDFQIGEVLMGFLGVGCCENGQFIVTEITSDFITAVEKEGRNREVKLQKAFIRPLSEKFGIGYYYEDKDMPEYLSTQEIEYHKQKAFERTAEIKKLLDMRLQADIDESIRLKQVYPYLEYFPLSKLGQGSFIPHKTVAKNIRQWLKHHFPKDKFNVRMDGYNTIEVNCLNSQKTKEVEFSLQVFKDHVSNLMDDRMEYLPGVFNKCFGGTEFLFVH